jgi:hypothetical protein
MVAQQAGNSAAVQTAAKRRAKYCIMFLQLCFEAGACPAATIFPASWSAGLPSPGQKASSVDSSFVRTVRGLGKIVIGGTEMTQDQEHAPP